ncbi:MAG: indolepyruvate ferredoxin oxidoreductase family protein, partial [Rhodospirillales bacterium]|nr:indolepyruvate ferredoxin oxidoreductase family protein [Rhodospirillales bacterium]
GLAGALLGDAIAANLFMLGYAWQRGLVPLGEDSILKAIELNGAAVQANLQAFRWGRRAAFDAAAVAGLAHPPKPRPAPVTLDELVARRTRSLAEYQDEAYAQRYAALVGRVRAAEHAKGLKGLAETVARSLFKLMAIKDEYEVARLYADGSFEKALRERFDGDVRLEFHLAPPLLARTDPLTGHLRKGVYGPWMMIAFRLLARLRRLRGTIFDPFGHSAERRLERRLLGEYEGVIEELLRGVSLDTLGLAIEIAALPQRMRGFGHVKAANVAQAKAREAELLAAFRAPAAPRRQAAE